MRWCEDLLDRTNDRTPGSQEDDVGRIARRQGDIMRDKKDGQMLVLIEVNQQLEQGVGGGEVETVRRLVEEEELRLPHQGTRHQGALPLATRQGPVTPQCHLLQANASKRPLQAAGLLTAGEPQADHAKRDELAHRRRQAGVEIATLRHEANAFAPGALRMQPQLSSAGMEFSQDSAKECRFAFAVWPETKPKLSPLDLQ
jgi:hypothetical protein